jgi:hypothetical protein
MRAAVADKPVNPRAPAMIEMIRKMIAYLSMTCALRRGV